MLGTRDNHYTTESWTSSGLVRIDFVLFVTLFCMCINLLQSFASTRRVYERVDEVAEWLRRWTANPLGSARVGSNPIFVAPPHWFYGVMVSTLDFESSDPSSNLGRTWHLDRSREEKYLEFSINRHFSPI